MYTGSSESIAKQTEITEETLPAELIDLVASMDSKVKKRLLLDWNAPERIVAVGKALSSEARLKILRLLIARACNISEIAKELDIPLSTAAMHIKVLEDAEMVFVMQSPGVRGTQKLCGLAFGDVYFDVFSGKKSVVSERSASVSMPLGGYFDCVVTPPCGIIGEDGYLGGEDNPSSFYSSERFKAQQIWCEYGYFEYRFPTSYCHNRQVTELAFSFEVCSEAPGYCSDWPSDITVWINGHEITTFCSPGDFGGRHGLYSPNWWEDSMTQYGLLKMIRVNASGAFDDGISCSKIKISDLDIFNKPYLSLKIGVKEDAVNRGGINLFGEKFGDYPQGIVMRVTYR